MIILDKMMNCFTCAIALEVHRTQLVLLVSAPQLRPGLQIICICISSCICDCICIFVFAHRFDDWDDFWKFWLCLHLRFLLLSCQPLILAQRLILARFLRLVTRFSVIRCCWKLLRSWTPDSTCLNWTSPISCRPGDGLNEDLMRFLSQKCKKHLNSTDANLAPKKMSVKYFFQYRRGIAAHIHCFYASLRHKVEKDVQLREVLLRFKYRDKRIMFCKINFSTYFIMSDESQQCSYDI